MYRRGGGRGEKSQLSNPGNPGSGLRLGREKEKEKCEDDTYRKDGQRKKKRRTNPFAEKKPTLGLAVSRFHTKINEHEKLNKGNADETRRTIKIRASTDVEKRGHLRLVTTACPEAR